MTVRWSSTDIAGNVEVMYSTDSAGTWNAIGTAPATAGQIAWTIPATASKLYYVRVRDAATGTMDLSDGTFEVAAPLVPKLRVITPNVQTVTWREGDSVTITWSAENVSQIDIKLSIDGGSTFRDIAQAVNATLGSYGWRVDHMSNDTLHSLVVRIVDASDPSLFDDSDEPFGFLPLRVSGVASEAVTGMGLSLEGAYPNPVSDRTELRWHQSTSSTAVVRVYASSGRLVGETPLGTLGAGEHRSTIHVDGLASGVYLYEINTAQGTLRGSFVVAR